MGKWIKSAAIAVAAVLLATAAAKADTLCFDEAGSLYSISPQILRAIAKVESNYNPAAINKNTNGTFDYGVMQINSIWAPTLGTERWNSLGNACTNIKTGAMILSGCVKKYGYNWQAIGCYNSQTPGKRERYARRVFKQLQRIQKDEKEGKVTQVAALKESAAPPPAVEALSGKKGKVELAAASTAPETQVVELDSSSVFEVDRGGL
ncbi:lytic transglycosylase domain-containing protein [Geomonas sp. RF6]|uniref:lytic transglycosylase domain-containing protein n=1 Tax=Geomonas sp. RF6 TaxID=2897342 RepID=UPI001E34AC8D|nr:lytic transglycosylase domain-containing protein [Geomonas sp. RF6]UFS70027.1 lytic transglycosylase domain-containing protein [Geomonas sp. RF6]